jgi:MFS family permease
VPGGRLGELIGVKRIFGASLGLASILTFATPAAAYWDYKALIALRVLVGVLQGATFPSMHALIAKWAPPDERSKISSFIYAGKDNISRVVNQDQTHHLRFLWRYF